MVEGLFCGQLILFALIYNRPQAKLLLVRGYLTYKMDF